MKTLVFVMAFAICAIGLAQDSTTVKVEAPKIISKLQHGKSATFKDVEVKFVELISDSRCPKNVSCIWAGEVEIMVEIIKSGAETERKKMTFNARGKGNPIYVSEGFSITGVNISPYPVYGKKIALEDYKMELYIKN